MSKCSKCYKKLGIFSIKHKTLDEAIVCGDCIKEWEKQENLKKGPGLITRKGDTAIYQKVVTVKGEEAVKKIPVTCPACNENFETEINFAKAEQTEETEEVNFDTACPQCGIELKGTIKKTGVEEFWHVFVKRKTSLKVVSTAQERGQFYF